jgi:DNA-binding GntR family transcriptional regulator
MNQSPVLDQDLIYHTLADEILQFEHKPGDILSEHMLCQRFGMSRTPARSILQRLQENGLVQIVPHKGSMVTKLNYDIVNQSIYQRVAVESMVFRDFILSCSPIDVEKVRYAMQRLDEIGQVFFTHPEKFEVNRFLRIDFQMHELWFRATKKRYLWEKLSGSIQASYTRFCTLDIIEGSNVRDVLDEHWEMLRMIDEKRIDGIEELFRKHLYGGVRRLSGLMFTKYADYFETPEEEDEYAEA